MSNSKKNSNGKKTMDDYRRVQENKNKRARVIAIVLIAVMVLFTFITSGLSLIG